jgi:hypothetical protein
VNRVTAQAGISALSVRVSAMSCPPGLRAMMLPPATKNEAAG